MTIRIYAEDTIAPPGPAPAPVLRRINLRNDHRDVEGPHLVTFGIRTVVAGVSAAFCQMRMQYETPNGEVRLIDPGAADLTSITDAGGGMWYAQQVLVIDKRYPLGNGPNANDPFGFWVLDFNCGAPGSPPAKISYECIIQTFDGSSSVINIP